KTGHVTDQVRRLRRLYLLRRWLRGRRPSEQRWSAPAARLPASPTARPTARRRWLGWLIVGLLGLMLGGLALASTHAPVVSAAGNPLYLHGTGTAPGCTASTIDQNSVSTNPVCHIQSKTSAVATIWTLSNLPA